MPNESDLTGKTVLVTGAAGGLRAVIATVLERTGARIFATVLDSACLAQAKTDRCAAWDTRVPDVSNIQDISRIVGSIVADADRIDILVNGAGIYRMQFLSDITEAGWDALRGRLIDRQRPCIRRGITFAGSEKRLVAITGCIARAGPACLPVTLPTGLFCQPSRC